ncbi:carboxyl transferase domain-containing protein [Kribbella sp. NPDC056951]|uniref:carboxyl transferase domain-containing protein n=1 Tax=Kribbella sp. NPDC056951 TaxID=3345978 RepID=UPI003638D61A
MLRCLAIIGRGAPALQVIHAVRDLNGDLPSDRGVRAVVLHLSEDRSARCVRDADAAVELGSARDHLFGEAAVLARVLTEVGADAVWTGGWPDAEDCVREVCRTLGLPLLGAGCEPAVAGVVVGSGAVVAAGIDRLVDELRIAADVPVGAAGVVRPAFAAAAELRLVDLENGSECGRRIRLLELPGGTGIQVDPGVSQGDAVCALGSPVVARITAYGATAREAIARLGRALTGTTVVAAGARSNKGELLAELGSGRPQTAGRIALVAAAVEACARALAEDVATFLDTAARGLPALGADDGHAVHLGLDGITYRVHALQRTKDIYQLSIHSEFGAAADVEVQVERLDAFRRRLTMDGSAVTVVTSAHVGFELVEVAGHPIRIEHRDGLILRSPIPALVVQQSVAEGMRVVAGTPLAVLESMKLESVVRAPFDCEVGEWLVQPGAQVAYGAPLVRVGSVVLEAKQPATGDVLSGGADPATRLGAHDEMLAQILGFDADEAIASARLAAYRTTSGGPPGAEEVDLLTAYTDLDDLYRCADFHRYLRSRSSDDEDGLWSRLKRASAWYGVAELPAPDVLLRICRAHRRRESTAKEVVAAVLQRWLHESASGVSGAQGVLDRLSEAERARELRDLALAVRHRWYERPSPDTLNAPELGDAARRRLHRLELFQVKRVPSDVPVYECRAAMNPSDRRLVAIGEISDPDDGKAVERVVNDCMAAVRIARASAPPILGRIHIWIHGAKTSVEDLAPLVDDPDLEELILYGRPGRRLTLDPLSRTPVVSDAQDLDEPLRPFDADELRSRQASARGYPSPHHLGRFLAGADGSFTELNLDADGALVPVDRGSPRGSAGLVVGTVTTVTPTYPEGMTRVLMCGDPTRALGAVAEPECRRIIAAIDLAERLGVPVEWFALSSGARISMDSGTENMDWVAAALRRIVSFTQAGGEINVVAAGINVGAQPYWNAEATMLMHTKGVLIMTPLSAMVLTGKRSLDFSGAVSADSEAGIGGYERVMGPNGQGQYWAPNLAGAAGILMRHYDHTYVAPGEVGPRWVPTADPVDRDISEYPHAVDGCDFRTVGEIFSVEHNPERKKAFDIRTVMRAVTDQDSTPLERWADMADAENAVVLDARLGGHAVCLLGVESRPTRRQGLVPADGPPMYSAATLFPRASKKLARAINAASGNRPLVVLANLAGFDGSPDSLRNLQLEYGAEIGRAVVNFQGPIVFCVVGRYHGGAFVVFSKRLNPNLTALAVAGARASVIGGAPAANVVLSGEARRRARADGRVAALEADLESISGPERLRIGLDLADVRDSVQAQMLDELAHEFDRVHDVDRAVAVGSVDAVIPPGDLRPAIIAAVEKPGQDAAGSAG